MTSPDTILAVEAVLTIPFLILGISHILYGPMWVRFFSRLAAQGTEGVLWRTFLFELWPASLIVVFHQDWSWPGAIISVYGHLLMAKVIVSTLVPALGLRSLKQADRTGPAAFISAGLVLFALGTLCAYRVAPQFLASVGAP
ncbi:MAG: hypothetical protein AAGH41_04140 [Pseudomonadota bacterium]